MQPGLSRQPGRVWLPRPAVLMMTALLSVVGSTAATAHVKWFCAYDLVGSPRGLGEVLCADFEQLVGLSLLALIVGGLLEGTVLGAALIRSLDRTTAWARDNTELLFRAVCGGFFVALWTLGGVILTPELKTANAAIPWFQLAIATGFLWRRTMPFSALGIVVLFATAIHDYGAFHLADYPVFLGVAAYIALTGLGRQFPGGIRPLDVVRYTAAITLMWASVEKWAYPQWSFPLFIEHPGDDPRVHRRVLHEGGRRRRVRPRLRADLHAPGPPRLRDPARRHLRLGHLRIRQDRRHRPCPDHRGHGGDRGRQRGGALPPAQPGR